MAAEPSGDLQGAALAAALKQRIPDLNLFGVGCARMKEQGVRLLADASVWGTIGPSEAIAKIWGIYLVYRKMKSELLRVRPEVTVVIDSPAIHMRLARFLKRRQLGCVYYFPPSAWSSNPKRFQQIYDRSDGIVTTFEFNHRNYTRCGLKTAYYGHPMVDLFQPLQREEARTELGLSEGRYVALLPGSRTQEIRLLAPVLVEAARRMREAHPELQFLMPAASLQVELRLRRLLGELPPWLHLFQRKSREAIAASEVVLMCSGSASLEATLLDVPMVIGYKFNRFDYALARFLRFLGLFNVQRFALPNLILDEDALTEYFQEQVTPEALSEHGLRLLEGGPERSDHLAVLHRVREAMGASPVVSKIAAFVDYMGQGRGLETALEAVEQELWTPT